MISINSLILFRIRKNCLISRSPLLCLFTKRGIKLIVIIIVGYPCHHFHVVLLSRLSPYIDDITGAHQSGFQCNRSTSAHIFCSYQILEKKLGSYGTVHKVQDFNKDYDSLSRELLYNNLIEFGVPIQLIRLIKIRLNETYSKVRIAKPLPHSFHI
jgi:hypothetical protein